jgi:hypothetical protein
MSHRNTEPLLDGGGKLSSLLYLVCIEINMRVEILNRRLDHLRPPPPTFVTAARNSRTSCAK